MGIKGDENIKKITIGLIEKEAIIYLGYYIINNDQITSLGKIAFFFSKKKVYKEKKIKKIHGP